MMWGRQQQCRKARTGSEAKLHFATEDGGRRACREDFGGVSNSPV